MEPEFILEKRNRELVRLSVGTGRIIDHSFTFKDIIESKNVEVKTTIVGKDYYIIISNISKLSDREYIGEIDGFRTSEHEEIPLELFKYINQTIKFSEEEIHTVFFSG